MTLFPLAQGQSVQDMVKRGLEMDSAAQYDKAIAWFSEAISANPEEAVIWYNRGVSRMKLEQFGLAIVDFNKAIYLDTSLVNAYFNRSQAFHYTGNYQFALADITRYLQSHPQEPEALALRADLALEMKEPAVAQRDLETLRQLDPSNLEVTLTLADVAIQNQQYTLAETVLTQVIDISASEPELYLSRAFVRHYQGDYEKSQSDIHLFGLYVSDNAEAEKLKGNNYFFLKQFSEAANIFEKLLLHDSTNVNLLADYGHCLLQLEKYAEAEIILTKCIRARNDAPAYAYLGRGIARYNIGMGDKACEDWEKSWKLGENSAKKYLETNCEKENTTK